MAKEYFGYVYITTNISNGKQYIGQKASSIFIESYKGSGTILKNAINKYGEDNFKTEVIEWCVDQKELDERERYWISFYDAVESDDFYNLASGGSFGNARKGSKLSDEARKKLSEVHLGEKNSMYGKHHTEETKQKISKNHADFTGDKSPSYNRIAINNGTKVKYVIAEDLDSYLALGWIKGVTDEYKERAKKTSLGRKHTEETKKKLSERQKGKNNGMYGKHLSDATKKKLTEQRTGRKWINNGIELKLVKQEDIDKFLLDGWVLGRFEMPKEQKEKISKSGKNLCLINNGKENKRVKLEDVDFYLKQGWLLGFTKGKILNVYK